MYVVNAEYDICSGRVYSPSCIVMSDSIYLSTGFCGYVVIISRTYIKNSGLYNYISLIYNIYNKTPSGSIIYI